MVDIKRMDFEVGALHALFDIPRVHGLRARGYRGESRGPGDFAGVGLRGEGAGRVLFVQGVGDGWLGGWRRGWIALFEATRGNRGVLRDLLGVLVLRRWMLEVGRSLKNHIFVGLEMSME